MADVRILPYKDDDHHTAKDEEPLRLETAEARATEAVEAVPAALAKPSLVSFPAHCCQIASAGRN